MIRVTERKLGSTEIAPVAALYLPSLAESLPKRWGNASDVWMRLLYGIKWKGNRNTSRGEDGEPELLQCYRENVGPAWRPPDLATGEPWIVRHPSLEWATASPDATDSPPPFRAVIEFKTQSIWAQGQWGTPGSDKIPERYLYQVAWAMSCLDASEALLLVAFGVDTKDERGESTFIYERTVPYHVERNWHVERQLISFGQRFWNDFVVTRKPPPVTPTNNRRKWKAILNGRYSEVERGVGEGSEDVQASPQGQGGTAGQQEVQILGPQLCDGDVQGSVV